MKLLILTGFILALCFSALFLWMISDEDNE